MSRAPTREAPRPRTLLQALPPALLVLLVLPLLTWSAAPAWSAPPVAPPPGAAARPDVAPALPTGVWPLRPRPQVARFFDPPDVLWGAGHRGVDLVGRVGQPVRAALAGRVVFAGRIAGRGVVVVSHGALRTTYEPVATSVPVGEPVGTGQAIGRLEWFGSHCQPRACLHWGLLEGERYLDPLTLVGGPQPVRLLPLGGLALTPVPVGRG